MITHNHDQNSDCEQLYGAHNASSKKAQVLVNSGPALESSLPQKGRVRQEGLRGVVYLISRFLFFIKGREIKKDISEYIEDSL